MLWYVGWQLTGKQKAGAHKSMEEMQGWHLLSPRALEEATVIKSNAWSQ